MRIGLLPPFEMSGAASASSAGALGPRPQPAVAAPFRLAETDVTPPAIYGGSYVDLDHQ